MPQVRWSDGALAEFDAIIDYILPFDEVAAVKIAERLRAAALSLADFRAVVA